MSYIGQGLPADTFQGFTTDKFTGDGTANKAFTLTKEPFSEDTILVTIDGVVQEPTDDFTVSGTTLTLVGTAANNSEINVTHMGGPLPIGGASELDLNGASDKLILDADADTTISADTDDQIDFKTGGTDRLTVQSTSGNNVVVADGLTLTDGNITFSGSGHGIHLGVTSANSANLLDDYEEGTFTIALKDSSGNAITLDAQDTGHYVKVGNIVHINGYVVGGGNLGSASGDFQLHGLPFNIPGSSHFYSTLSVGYAAGLAIGSGTSVQGFAVINTAYVQLTNFDATTGTSHLQASEFSSDGAMIFQLSYAVA
tara:strand:+ start:1383 stop:2321 length:939 start_codon:yes stop_codon:yes gene_type:complete